MRFVSIVVVLFIAVLALAWRNARARQRPGAQRSPSPATLAMLSALALGACVTDSAGRVHAAPQVHVVTCSVACFSASVCGAVDPSMVVHLFADGHTQVTDQRAEVLGDVVAKMVCGVSRAACAGCSTPPATMARASSAVRGAL